MLLLLGECIQKSVDSNLETVNLEKENVGQASI